MILKLELDKHAKTSEGKTLRSIVEDKVGRYSCHHVVATVVPSGSGKTVTVVDLMSKHFVICCVCCIPSPAVSPGLKDPNFIKLAEDVESINTTINDREHGSMREPQDIDSEMKALAEDCVEIASK